MKIILNSFLFILCITLFVPLVFAEEGDPVNVTASFDKESITIGEKVKYIVRIESDEGIEIKIPVFDNVLAEAGFAVRDFGEEKVKKIAKERMRQENWLLLDTYVTGSYVVPPIAVEYIMGDGNAGEVYTQEIFIEVKSVIEEGEEANDIKDIKQPVEIKVGYKKLILSGIGIFVAVFLCMCGMFLYKKYKKHKEEAMLRIPAHIIALKELEKAKQMNVENEKEVKEYYILVSNIVRQYIENRFGLHAPERTTEEFLSELANEDILEKQNKNLLREFLKHCDMVKFAKYDPSREEIGGAYATGKKFVEETKASEEIDKPR